jgi:hypothetical protein
MRDVERMNRTIKDVTVKHYYYDNCEAISAISLAPTATYDVSRHWSPHSLRIPVKSGLLSQIYSS